MNDDKALLEIFNRYERIEAEFPGIRREAAGNVIRHVSPHENRGFISYSQLSPDTCDEDIERQVEYFRSLGMDFEWKVYDYDQPLDLITRLTRHGFKIEDREALLILDLEDASNIINEPVPDSVRRLTHPDEIEAVEQVEARVWNEDYSSQGARLRRDLLKDPEHLSIFVAYAGPTPVSSAWIYYDQKGPFCGIWGGSTLPEYRRQGWYTALLAVRLREAQQRGYRYVTIDASPMSRPIVEKYGFRLLGYSTPCIMKFNSQE